MNYDLTYDPQRSGYEAGKDDKEFRRPLYCSYDPAEMDFGFYRRGYDEATLGLAVDEYGFDYWDAAAYDEKHDPWCRCFYCYVDEE